MYSLEVIYRNLNEFEKREQWRPEYHTPDQIEEFKEYIDKITIKERSGRGLKINLARDITIETARRIRRWIENEQVLCSLDSSYFETRYAWVCDHKGEIFKFRNRKAQEVFDNIIAEFDEQQVATELLVLKARQTGITTKTALKFIQRVLFVPNTQAVMGSVNDEKSELITRIIETCINKCPWWLIPQRTTDRIRMLGFANNSLISVQSGMQATGIAQGWTPTCTHLSEIGDVPNPKKVIEEGLLRATHSSHKLFQVLEGTGNGNTGWLAEKWRASKEDWPKGRARLCPVFINWPMAPDLYPEPDWIKKFPVPHEWRPLDVTRKHVKRCELFIHSTPYLRKVAGGHWKMPIEQQWFWEFNYLEAAKTHTQKVWLSQMPADDYEALTGKNDLVFDPIVVETARKERQQSYKPYCITGKAIDDGFEPNEYEIDYNSERLLVQWNSHRGEKYDWLMVPMQPIDDDQERNTFDKLLVWEAPNMMPGRENQAQDYSIGIDTADGLGKEDEERTVISVTRSMSGTEADVQVAELTSTRINPAQAVGFAACIAAWYGQNNRDSMGVKFCIEQRERPGDDCQFQLKLMGFTYHHKMIYYDKARVRENESTIEGFRSSAWSVPMMMGRFVEAVNGGWYKANSRYLIEELGSLERQISERGKSRMRHQSGKYDDRVRAAAQSYFTRHHMDILAQRSQMRYSPPTAKPPELNRSWATASLVSVGD